MCQIRPRHHNAPRLYLSRPDGSLLKSRFVVNFTAESWLANCQPNQHLNLTEILRNGFKMGWILLMYLVSSGISSIFQLYVFARNRRFQWRFSLFFNFAEILVAEKWRQQDLKNGCNRKTMSTLSFCRQLTSLWLNQPCWKIWVIKN